MEIGETPWLIRIERGIEIEIELETETETETERGIETEINIVKKAGRVGAAENATAKEVGAGNGIVSRRGIIVNTDGGTEVTISINAVRANEVPVM